MQRYMFLTLFTIKYIGSSDTRPGHLRPDANPLSSEEPAKELARNDCRATASSSDINDAKKCLDDMKDTWQTGLSENPADTDPNAYYALASFDLGLLETVEPPKDAILPETPQNSLECISSDPALDTFDQANLNIAHKTQTESGMHHSSEQGFKTTQNSILGSLLSGNNNGAITSSKNDHEPLTSKLGSVGTNKTDEYVTDQQMLVAKPTEGANNSSLLDRSQEDIGYLMPESNIEHSTWQQARGLNSQTPAAPLAARRRSGKDLQHKVMCSKRFKVCETESSERKCTNQSDAVTRIDYRSLASNLDAHHHRESEEELYYKRFKAQLIDLHNINEASNAFMSKLIDFRIIFPHNSIRSQLFSEDALQFNYLLYVLSCIRYSATYEIVNYIITTYTAKLGVKSFFHTIDTFNAKFMETAANLMPLFINPDDFIQQMQLQVQQYLNIINEVISFAEKQALFIKFVEETILDQTGNGKYVLKPHMWKLQMYMPEIGPYFNWRFTFNGNLSYRGVVSDFDFAKEMGYIRILLENHFNDNPADKDHNASSTNQGIVYEYREYIRKLLQSDQYCRSIDYRIYQFAFDLRSNSENMNMETIRQNLVFMLAFSIQDQESVILNQWTMADLNEIFSLERLDSFFLKNLECGNTNFNVITHEIFFHKAINIRKNSVGYLTLADEQSFIVCFISGIWIMTYTKEDNALHVLRLTRKQMFEYFHDKIYGYYCY